MFWVGLDIGQKRHGVVILDYSNKKLVASTVAHRASDIVPFVVEHVPKESELTVIYEIPTPYTRSVTALFITAANIGATLVLFRQTFPNVRFMFLPRQFVKHVLLGTTRAGDREVRSFLKDWWSNKLVGVKIRGDAWAALAVLTTVMLVKNEPDYDIVRMWRDFCSVWNSVGQNLIEGDIQDDTQILLGLLKEVSSDDVEINNR